MDDFKNIRWPHIYLSLIGSGRGFSEIQAPKKRLGSLFIIKNHFTGRWSPFVLSQWVPFGLTFTFLRHLQNNSSNRAIDRRLKEVIMWTVERVLKIK